MSAAPTNVLPFPARRARSAFPASSSDACPWRRIAVTAKTLDQFAGLRAADVDAMIGAMVQADPGMVAGLLERSAADIRFLGGALRTLVALDAQVAAAADRVLAKEGA